MHVDIYIERETQTEREREKDRLGPPKNTKYRPVGVVLDILGHLFYVLWGARVWFGECNYGFFGSLGNDLSAYLSIAINIHHSSHADIPAPQLTSQIPQIPPTWRP